MRAILIKRSLCVTDLARTFPRPSERRVPNPKHDLRYRAERVSRFLANDRVSLSSENVTLTVQ